MPCGSRARITAYVVYQSLAFAERDVLLAALADAGYSSVESADVGTQNTNPLSVAGPSGRTNATAAIVVRAPGLPAGFGDLGFMVYEGAYVPVVPADARRSEERRVG